MAKAILGLSSTRALSVRLEAGRPLPHESTFSRVFAVLARTEIPERTHGALVDRFVKDSGIVHSALDASAIEAREKALNPRKPPAVTPKEEWPAERSGVALLSAHDAEQGEEGPFTTAKPPSSF